MQEAQYWKPGEAKPKTDDGESGPGTSGNDHRSSKNDVGSSARDRKPRSSTGESREPKKGNKDKGGGVGRRDSTGSSKNRDKKAKGKDRHGGKVEESPSASRGKPAVAGPSQGLLAMKFMQRKVKVDEAQQQQQEKRDKMERDFSSSYAKRLKSDQANGKDRLSCRRDELDPALVIVGRRSFGGFNTVAEAAYEACVRDIAEGARLGQSREEDDDKGGGGISDAEMAERLGNNARRGRR